jgi:hypothetical protein
MTSSAIASTLFVMSKPQRFGGFEIDNQREFDRLRHRQIGWFHIPLNERLQLPHRRCARS